MKYDDAITESKITPEVLAVKLPELNNIHGMIKEGEKLFAEQQQKEGGHASGTESLSPEERSDRLVKNMRASVEAFGPTPAASDTSSKEHQQLLDTLRTVVYDTDQNIKGKRAAIGAEVDEALGALIKGGSYSDTKLAQVVGELFALEGRAASGALSGNFAELEVVPADLPMDNSKVASIGTANTGNNDAAKKIAEQLKKHPGIKPPDYGPDSSITL